jgi:hypothetical protein
MCLACETYFLIPNQHYHFLLSERENSIKKIQSDLNVALDIVGTTRAIADAIVIKTAYEMIREEYGNATIEINSLGDKDSLPVSIENLTTI